MSFHFSGDPIGAAAFLFQRGRALTLFTAKGGDTLVEVAIADFCLALPPEVQDVNDLAWTIINNHLIGVGAELVDLSLTGEEVVDRVRFGPRPERGPNELELGSGCGRGCGGRGRSRGGRRLG